MPLITQEGIFKAEPNARVSVKMFDSGSVALGFKFRITHFLKDDEWHDWSQYNLDIFSDLFIIGKDGNTVEKSCETARDILGWDGNLETAQSMGTPAVQLNVKPEEYKGKTRYKVAYINPIDYSGGEKSANPDAIKKLQQLHGAKLRAMMGTTAPKPGGAPQPPPHAITSRASSRACGPATNCHKE